LCVPKYQRFIMRINEEILTLVCNTDCPRYKAGDCPFTIREKSLCPRVKEKLSEIGPCCASCVNLVKERPFDQQEWYVCSRDVNGPVTLENIKNGIITSDIYEKTDCFAWSMGDDEQ